MQLVKQLPTKRFYCCNLLGPDQPNTTNAQLGVQGVVWTSIATHYNLQLLPKDNWVTWVLDILYDVCYYWMHRMSHEVKVLWASHVVHHQGEEFNLSTALRQTSSGWLWKWIFYTPMFFVGVPGEVFFTVAAVNSLYQFWVHTSYWQIRDT